MPKSKVSLHSTTDPRDITKVLRDIHAENCFDTNVVGDIFSDTGISLSELMDRMNRIDRIRVGRPIL